MIFFTRLHGNIQLLYKHGFIVTAHSSKAIVNYISMVIAESMFHCVNLLQQIVL